MKANGRIANGAGHEVRLTAVNPPPDEAPREYVTRANQEGSWVLGGINAEDAPLKVEHRVPAEPAVEAGPDREAQDAEPAGEWKEHPERVFNFTND